MESMTKAKLTRDQIRRLVDEHFGREIRIHDYAELHNGWFNTAYDLLLSDGRSVILKVAPENQVETLTCEKHIMSNEVGVLKLLHEKGAIPVPEVYAYDTSFNLIPSEYFFMEKVAGQPYNLVKDSLTEDEQDAIEEELGRYNRQINEYAGSAFGPFFENSEDAYPTWREAFSGLMSDLLSDGRKFGVRLPIVYEQIEEAVAAKLPILNEVTEPRLVHWDLWSGNVFVDQGRITAIIDWERALWGDPLFEYYFSHMENSNAFYRGYGSRFDAPHEKERRKLYDLYLDLIYVIECRSRKYEDPDHLQWVEKNFITGWNTFQG
ncbi:phosphotransferase family protein [Paenibacillus sp. SAF-054]|uniref:phosphotransferase family protein n=1 Tax=unclassified Paenibacillus TaxID=185978 RepID=UPI003F7D6476